MENKLNKLRLKIEEIENLKSTSEWGPEYQLWKDLTEKLVTELFGTKGLKLFDQQNAVVLDNDAYLRELDGRKKILEGLISNKDEYSPDTEAKESKNTPKSDENSLFQHSVPNKIAEGIWFGKLLGYIGRKIKNRFLRILFYVIAVFVVIFLVLKCTALVFWDTGHFQYQPQAISYSSKSISEPGVIDILFQGDIRNISSSPRYLRNFVGVLWKNESLGSTWSYTYSTDVGDVYLVQGATTTSALLPLRFEPNETKTVTMALRDNATDDPKINQIFI